MPGWRAGRGRRRRWGEDDGPPEVGVEDGSHGRTEGRRCAAPPGHRPDRPGAVGSTVGDASAPSDGISADSGHLAGGWSPRNGPRHALEIGQSRRKTELSGVGRFKNEPTEGPSFRWRNPWTRRPGGRLSALGKFVVAQPEAGHRRRKEAPTRRKANLPPAEGASPRDDTRGFRTRTARHLPSYWRVAARAPAVSDSKIVGDRPAARAGSLGIAYGESWSLNIDHRLPCGDLTAS